MVATDPFPPYTVGNLFKLDEHNKALPEIATESRWAQGSEGFVSWSVLIDGTLVKLKEGIPFVWVSSDIKGGSCWVPAFPGISSDKVVFDAIKQAQAESNYPQMPLPDGLYCAFGEGIAGNAMKAERTSMVKIVPAEQGLLIHRGGVKFSLSREMADEQIYLSIKHELAESRVKGVVFALEVEAFRPTKWCKVTRKQMGLSWPL